MTLLHTFRLRSRQASYAVRNDQAPHSRNLSLRVGALVAWGAGLLAVLIVLMATPLRAQGTFNDAIVGYAMVNLNGDVLPGHSYQPDGRTVDATKVSIGSYTVTFNGAGDVIQGGGNVQVSSTVTGASFCFLDGWITWGSDVIVDILCKDVSGGPSDEGFTVLLLDTYSDEPGMDNETLAFAWSQEEAPTGGELDLTESIYTHNPAGGAVTLEHYSTGVYKITFEELESMGLYVRPQITAYDNDPEGRFCRYKFSTSASGTDHKTLWLDCYNDAGELVDTRFSFMVPQVNESVDNGFASATMADRDAPAEWSEDPVHGDNAFGTVEGRQPSEGTYEIRLNGMHTGIQPGGIVSVTPNAPNSEPYELYFCWISWVYYGLSDDDLLAEVQCEDTDGVSIKGKFSILTTFVNAMPVADEATPAQLADALTAPSPNPARETARVSVAVEHGQNVTVEVFDIMGRRVQTPYDAPLAAGMAETLELDASALPAGVYVIRATGEDFAKSRRVTVVK